MYQRPVLTSVVLSNISSTSLQETRPSCGLKNLVKDCNLRLVRAQVTKLEQFLENNGLADHEKFDVIQWWKAKDVIAIPVSMVTLESSFSTQADIHLRSFVVDFFPR